MKALSGVDGAFLHFETAATPMHVGSLHVFELPPGYRGSFHDRLKRQMRGRLRRAPIFTRKLALMPLQFANPVWVEADSVDMDYHVQHLTLPAPGTQQQLEDCAGRLHAQLLDRSHPLWQLTVIDGLQGGLAAYYIKVHHAVLDGQAGVLLAQALFDLTPKPARAAATVTRPGEHPGPAMLAAAALKHDAGQIVKLVRHLPDVVRTLAGMLTAKTLTAAGAGGVKQNFAFGPKTSLNGPITGARGFTALSVPLETLKGLAKAHDAKLNDVVLALCSGALRRWLKTHGGVPKKPLTASMPISLRAAGNTDYTTQATLSLVNLHTQLADPIKRLAAIRDASTAMKALAKSASGVIPTDYPTLGAPWLLHALATIYGRPGVSRALPVFANVVISNVPGPALPLYAAGAKMLSYWPMSIVEHGLGLNITVMSYAGTMGFGFTCAANAVPDASELGDALQQSLAELIARTAAAAGRHDSRRAPRKTAP